MSRIVRYSFAERLMHALSAISYIYLLLTGLAFWTPAFYWIAVVLGGGYVSRVLHPWIGLVFTALFSAGVLLVSLFADDVHLDNDSVLLGELAFAPLQRLEVAGWDLGPQSLWVMTAILLLNVLFIAVFWKELKLATFDAGLAAALGFSPALLHYGLMALVSVTCNRSSRPRSARPPCPPRSRGGSGFRCACATPLSTAGMWSRLVACSYKRRMAPRFRSRRWPRWTRPAGRR